MNIGSFSAAVEETLNPFTGTPATKETVTDIISDDISVTIEDEITEQLRLLGEDLDIVTLYKRYLNDENAHLSDMEQIALGLAVESLTTKMEMMNNNILGGLDVIMKKQMDEVHTQILDMQSIFSYVRCKLNNTHGCALNMHTQLTKACSFNTLHANLTTTRENNQQISEFHNLHKDSDNQEIVTDHMYKLFTKLASLGYEISITNNKLQLSYHSTSTEGSPVELGYTRDTDIRKLYLDIVETYESVNYLALLDQLEENNTTFKMGIESFNIKLDSNQMIVGDTPYVNEFTNMIIHKKRMIIFSKIIKANLSACQVCMHQFCNVLSCLDNKTLTH